MIEDLRCSLPYDYKLNKDKFKNEVSTIEHLIRTKQISKGLDYDIVMTVITIYMLNNDHKTWKIFVKKIFESMSKEVKFDLFKLFCINIKDKDDVKYISESFTQIIKELNNDEDIFKLCFTVSNEFLKPILISSIKKISIIPRELIYLFTTTAYDKFKSKRMKIICLQKLSDIQNLNDEHYNYLLLSIEDPEYTNIILDIFLRSDNWKYVQLAEKLLNPSMKRYFDVDNNVHYFEINTDSISKCESNDIYVSVLEEIVDTARSHINNISEIYDLITHFINSCYRYKDIELKDVVVFVWSKVIDKADFIIYLQDTCSKNICIYGIMINILLYLKVVDETDYVMMSSLFTIKDDILNELYKTYENDDDIWLDNTRLEQVIREKFSFIKNIDEVLKLIIL